MPTFRACHSVVVVAFLGLGPSAKLDCWPALIKPLAVASIVFSLFAAALALLISSNVNLLLGLRDLFLDAFGESVSFLSLNMLSVSL